jgi:hypothetical protein
MTDAQTDTEAVAGDDIYLDDADLEALPEPVRDTLIEAGQAVPRGADGINLGELYDFQPKYAGPIKGSVLQVRIPEALHRLMDVLRHKEGIPYLTHADMVRDALYYLTRYLSSIYAADRNPIINAMKVEAETAAAARFIATQEERIKQVHNDTRDYLITLLGRGDWPEIGRTIRAYWASINQIGLPAWERRYRDLFHTVLLTELVRILTVQGEPLPSDLVAFTLGGTPSATTPDQSFDPDGSTGNHDLRPG